MQTGQSPAARKPAGRFRLTRSFATVAALVMAAAAALLLSAFHWTWSLGELVKMGEQNNVNVARVLSNVLWTRNGPLMETLATVDRETLKDRPEVTQLRADIMRFIADAPIYPVKIFGRDGDIIFSTDPDQIGWNVHDRPGFATLRDVLDRHGPRRRTMTREMIRPEATLL